MFLAQVTKTKLTKFYVRPCERFHFSKSVNKAFLNCFTLKIVIKSHDICPINQNGRHGGHKFTLFAFEICLSLIPGFFYINFILNFLLMEILYFEFSFNF